VSRKTILASGHVRPRTQAAHMNASDPIKSLLNYLARRRPSTYAFVGALAVPSRKTKIFNRLRGSVVAD
jgi:hypothetical protein